MRRSWAPIMFQVQFQLNQFRQDEQPQFWNIPKFDFTVSDSIRKIYLKLNVLRRMSVHQSKNPYGEKIIS